MESKSEYPAIMTVEEIAAYLRCHKSTIYGFLKRSKIPGAFKIGSDWRFHFKEIEDWNGPTPTSPQE